MISKFSILFRKFVLSPLLSVFSASFLLFILIAALALSACINKSKTNISFQSSRAALPLMEDITRNASFCWVKSGLKEFRPFRLEAELQSFSGRPRLLIVSHNNPDGRPLFVIEATGNPAHLSAYGPLLQTQLGETIQQDLKRWINNDKNC